MIDVLLLSQPACHLCDHAKEMLYRLAPSFDLEIREMSLLSDAGRGIAEQHGLLFAPGLLLDGQPFSYGRLSERKLRRELLRRAVESP